jgi:hypothetical protein
MAGKKVHCYLLTGKENAYSLERFGQDYMEKQWDRNIIILLAPEFYI